MRILLTNDDGFNAPGIKTLYQEFIKYPEFELFLIAPESQRSAAGHSITLFNPLFIKRHSVDRERSSIISVTGTPADCVKLAIQGELCLKPDFVISGINHGPNLGTDIFYSGTVSAAMEGVLLGIPSIAVSLASFQYEEYQFAASFIVDFIKRYGNHIEGLININVPGTDVQNWRGTKVTKLGKAIYENIFEYRKDPKGREYYWQGGDLTESFELESDIYAINQNFISITPMHSDLTDYAKLNSWRGLTENNQND